ncbi:low temperature requirement protein A [Deinococcus multiflagellatus]|uniref:Low temperature requirement protein A n=1 Tax=Deinococcus multiflagellatus TaxID=1656887 RepID=A0ABW1ZL75_9DEIO|nr:low temperature requirement protein A [Deinococcus multiflagellatus]MBZ9713201.1 low temperature requirement protein A [Deinococcus multiflagellatus]
MVPNHRLWWQKPALHPEGDEARRVTFLELFTDLIFVVVIARLAHHLTLHPDLAGARDFALLFVPVWWVWIGLTVYSERFETYDLSFRVFTLLHLLAVSGMAASAEYGLGKTATAFALSYVAARVLITFMWWRAGRHNPHLRPVTDVFTLGFSLSIVLWVASIFVPPGVGLVLRALGLLADLLTPALTLGAQRRLFPAAIRKLPERFGLFVIIVLGESLVGVVNGLADLKALNLGVALRFVLAMLLGFGLWWVYFDFIGRREPQPRTRRLFAWSYLHLPLVLGITVVGAMTTHAVTLDDAPGVRWLLALGFAVFYLAVAALEFTVRDDGLLGIRAVTALRVGTAGAALLLAALPLGLDGLVAALVGLHVLHAAVGVRAWYRSDQVGRTDVH